MLLSFQFPWILLGLLLCLLLPRGRFWWLRVSALSLLLVSLAQPNLGQPSRAIAILVDVSDSLGSSAIEAAKQFDFRTLDGEPNYFFFAQDTTQVSTLDIDIPAFLDTSGTDMARAIQVAVASGAKRALVISDGSESIGNATLSLPDFPVDTFLVQSRDNVRLTKLIAPDEVSLGETAQVIAIIESDKATDIVLRPSVGDQALKPIQQSIPAGRQAIPFSFQVNSTDTLQISASIEAGFEQAINDDAQQLNLIVSSKEPILVLNDPALANLLITQGMDVKLGTPNDISSPLNYSAIVIRNSSGDFSTGQLELLKAYVRNGGGLMMSGGPKSFGFGAWYRTAVEDVLPVNTDLRTEVELPLVALVIVMDRSQSMSTGNPSKLDLAKEGAIGVVDLAYQDDLLGLIVFSDANATEWIFNPRPATARGKREMLNGILNIESQGGTVLKPAYEQALATLQQTEAAIKHIIILSDGKLYDGGGVFGGANQEVNFNAMAASGLSLGITTSTIAIGDGADFARLETMSLSGGGRYYEALDVSTLPNIFTNEALTATRSLLREESFSPQLKRHPLNPQTAGAVPNLNAYIATSIKPESEVLLEGLQNEPILAVSRQGLGRTAALTTDLNAWAGPLGNWDGLTSVLGTMVRWLQTQPAGYSATVSKEGTLLHIVVDAVEDGNYVNDQSLVVRYGGQSEPLEQVAPGRYEGYITNTGVNDTLLVIDGDDIVAKQEIFASTAEFDTDSGHLTLQTIAQQSGGDFLNASSYSPSTANEARPLWFITAFIALLIFIIELVLRRFGQAKRQRIATSR